MDDLKAEIRNLPGLKENELSPCVICGQEHTAPVFYRVTVENCVFDANAMTRQIGLGMAMGGNAAIAQVLGPNEDMAKVVSTETKIVCLNCALTTPIAGLI